MDARPWAGRKSGTHNPGIHPVVSLSGLRPATARVWVPALRPAFAGHSAGMTIRYK